MQIIMDIPEEKYDKLIEQMQLDSNFSACKISLLPKGHGKLVDLNEVIQNFCGKSCGCTLEECGDETPCPLVQRIISTPTIIEADA